jgi:hypothetical protein
MTEYSGTTDGRGQAGEPITFDTNSTESSLEIIDRIERHRYPFDCPTSLSPNPVGSDQFLFPVDAGITVTTAEIRLPTVVPIHVRDTEGELVGKAEHFAYEEFPADDYHVEINAPVKLYLSVSSALEVGADATQTYLRFDEGTDVAIGARSNHSRPAATITTTTDPEDLMAAVSTFGSGLKTTSPERSYPNLRGHPPVVNLGDRLSIPDGLRPPETGVRIEIPPDYRYIYTVAPLAYYLAARVTPGSKPKLVTEEGFEHPLDAVGGFEAEVERVLKQVFFFDCVTRTEGLYEIDLYNRAAVESDVRLDFTALYDAPLSERLEQYLEIPYRVIADYVPEWKLTTHIAPKPENVDTLAYIVDDLAIVRSPETTAIPASEISANAVSEFMRGEVLTRSTSSAAATRSYLRPENTESLVQTWIGDGIPVGAGKATAEAFRNRLERTPTEGDIEITVVCNDEEMREECSAIDTGYGERDELPFDLTLQHDLSKDELRELLVSRTDFFHYIGHIDGDGFDCTDGKLDAATLETVGVDAFLLNACQSYEQGLHLIEAGSIGGIVTLNDVINSGAVRIGRATARLLNRGFPLQAALEVAKGESIVGGQYIVVGDGSLPIAQAESGIPNVCEIEPRGERYEAEIRTYPTTQNDLGSVVIPYIADNDQYFLSSGRLKTFDLSRRELLQYLQLEDIPVRIDGSLEWSRDLSKDDL